MVSKFSALACALVLSTTPAYAGTAPAATLNSAAPVKAEGADNRHASTGNAKSEGARDMHATTGNASAEGAHDLHATSGASQNAAAGH